MTRERVGGRRFAFGLLALCILALAVRVSYVALAKSGPCPIVRNGTVVATYHSECTGEYPDRPNDQAWYNFMANQIAVGNGFTNPLAPHEAWADHPPLAALVLSSASFVFDHAPFSALADEAVFTNGSKVKTHVREQRYLMAIVGTLNVALIGLLARRIGGDSAGLLAAGFAALYPNLWVNDGLLFAETIAITCVLLVALAALRCGAKSGLRAFVVLGGAIGAAALARSELILFLPLLLVPLAIAARGRIRTMVLRIGVGALTTMVVLAPWFAYNHGRFDKTVLLSTNDGLALAGSNCDPVYYGSAIGLWTTEGSCSFSPSELARLGDQSRVSAAYRSKAVDYIEHHKRRLPVVVAARLGRTWSTYAVGQMVDYNQGENREPLVSWLGLVAYYPLMLAAAIGVVLLWRYRERRSLWVLLVPMISVTAVTVLTYGQTRFRATAEPSIVVLASLAVVWAVDAVRRRRVNASN